MIIAHLILTHNEPLQLKRLINRLAHPQAMFFVHVDLKADITSFINELNGIDKLYFIQNRVKVTWASYSMVQATLNSFTEMVKSGLPIDYINLLSAQDYPLTSAGAFYNYLEQHPEKAFMHCLDVNSDWTEAISRLTDYHLTNFEIPGKYKIQQIMNAVLPKRTIPNGMIPVGRSQWFTISYKHMLFLMHKLEQETKIANFFKLTWAPDEIIFQTLLFNSHYKVDIINDNLRYIDWSQGAKNPKVLGVEDLNAILSSGKFFGRKFSASADITVLNLLDQHIGWG